MQHFPICNLSLVPQLVAAHFAAMPRRATSRLRPAPVLLAVLALTLGSVAGARGQESTSSYNFGSLAIGASATQTQTLTIPSSVTLGGIAVSTQGAADRDFTDAGGGSCTVGTAYAANATCTVIVTFGPKLAGTRYGAVVLSDSSGNVLATDYLQGSGTGAQVNFLPGTESTIGSGIDVAAGVIVDGSGNLYIHDQNNSRVLKETWTGTGYIQSTFWSEPNVPIPDAVDGAGNLYTVNLNLNQVQKWTWMGSGYVQTMIGSGLYFPVFAVVDGVGNVYIADAYNGRVLKETLSAGSYTQSVILTCGIYGVHVCPSAVAVDGSGNVYVTGYQSSSTFDASKVLKMTPSAGGYTQSTVGSGMNWVNQVVVDGSGNLFVVDDDNSRILRETLSGSSYIQSTVTTSALNNPYGVAVDGSGNLYVANTFDNVVLKEDLADAPSLNFAPTAAGSTSSDSPMTVQVENIGNAALTLTAVGYPADFPMASGDANACTSSTSLNAGLTCDLPIDFTPQSAGSPLSENVTLTDNALNVSGAQSIAVSGTATGSIVATHLSVSAPFNAGANAPFTITVTALDASGGTATGYSGTVSLSSTDASAVLPAASTLTAGVGTFQVTLKTLGNQTITATDAANSFTATSGTIDVSSTPPGVFPSQGSVNFGSQAIGSRSGAQMLSFAIGAGTTVGSIGVLTQGAPNLDFINASGTTCTATTYASATTCTVDVTFTPKFAGVRMGAVVFFSAANYAGTVLASVPIYGIGTGSQIAFNPSPVIAIDPVVNGEGLNQPQGAVLDGTGDMFITDYSNNRVVEVPVGGDAPVVIAPTANGEGLNGPIGLALDGAGDLFIADRNNNRVVEVPVGGGAPTVIDPTVNGISLNAPTGLMIDGAGDLFIGDSPNNRVVEVPAGGGTPTAISPTVNGEGLNGAQDMALDSAGDLFITDSQNNRVVEVPAGGGAATAIDPTVNGVSFSDPNCLTVDVDGDLFISDHGNNRVVEVPVGGAPPIALDPVVNGKGLAGPSLLALDGIGDLFIGDSSNNRVVEVERSLPPAVNFPTATPVGTTDTADGAQTVQIFNYGNQALTFTGLSYPADFPMASGDANACTSSTSLGAGLTCDLPIDFTPESSGSLSESVTLTDNNMNAAAPGYATQTILLSGIGIGPTPASLTTPPPGSTLAGTSATFSWSPGLGVTEYEFSLGTTGVGSSNLYSGSPTTALSATVAGLPTSGVRIYARLSSMINGAWQHTDYTYTSVAVAVLTSPAPGSVLGTANVVFMWTTGTGVTQYELQLGTEGVGSSNRYKSPLVTTQTVTVPSVPSSGATVYARLWSEINNAWLYNDYVYTESAGAAAVLTAPAPGVGTVLGTSNVTFSWTPGTGVTQYELQLGSLGVGSSNRYKSPLVTAQSVTVPSVPSSGATVYARLWSEINNAWLYNDYVYTESPGAAAVLTTPAPGAGTVLGTSDVVFSWTAGTGVTQYALQIGTGGVGSANLYKSKLVTAQTVTVPSLPANGATVYVRLFSEINNAWVFNDYTCTEQ